MSRTKPKPKKQQAPQPAIIGFLCPVHNTIEIKPDGCDEYKKPENMGRFVKIIVLEMTPEEQKRQYDRIIGDEVGVCKTCNGKKYVPCPCGGAIHPDYGICRLCHGSNRMPCPECKGSK